MQEVLESRDERVFCKYVERRTGIPAIKVHRRGWPDRLVPLGGGRFIWIEFKRRSGGVVSKIQNGVKRKLERRGERIYVCRSAKEAKEVYEKEGGA